MTIRNLFNKYIKNTKHKAIVLPAQIFICTPRKNIQKVMSEMPKFRRVFVTTRALKHIYDRHIFDKKDSRDFYFILKNIKEIVGNPDRVYIDKPEKRGDFIFVKKVGGKIYMCTIEITDSKTLEVVSAHATGEKYLEKFALLWS